MNQYQIFIDPADLQRFHYWMSQQYDDEVVVIKPVGSFLCEDRNLAPRGYLGAEIQMDGMTYVGFRAAFPTLRGYTQDKIKEIEEEAIKRKVTLTRDDDGKMVIKDHTGSVIHRIGDKDSEDQPNDDTDQTENNDE